jgi:RNA polymerase sigma-70 factor (ECF subfamily)
MTNAVTVDIIQSAKTGDLASVATLYERHRARVFRYLLYRVGHRQTAEDLTSEVFLRMIRSLDGYKNRGISFQAWLFRIAHNLAVDHFRRDNNGREVELLESLPANDPGPAAAAEHNLTSESLRRALSKLEADQRDVVVLRLVVNMPIADVAQTLNRSEDAVKGLQRRGLIALRALLADSEVPYV